MIFLITFLVFISMTFLTYFGATALKKDRIQIVSRLNQILLLGFKKESSELDEPFKDRIIAPFVRSINKTISKVTPKVMKNKIEQYLQMAGKPIHPNSNKWLMVKLLLGFLIPIICFIFIYYINMEITFPHILSFIILSFILFYFPEIYLRYLANKRKKLIESTLPDVLDLLTVSVEAGLSFDSSVMKLAEKMPGVISDEFNRTMHEIRMGKKRKEAFNNMSKRCDVSDLSLFMSSLIQADELGIGISKVLRVQSTQMREKRRQRAQEKAMKAPVKILFPLIFFIFPTLFVIILGPALIRIMEIMSK